MKAILWVVSIICVLFGVLFIFSAFGTPFHGSDLFIGLVIVAIGLVIIGLNTRKKQKDPAAPVYKVDLTDNVKLQNMTCRSCGGPLEPKNVTLVAGVPTVKCPYCGITYQITEEPKW